jgi:hypothetical protein
MVTVRGIKLAVVTIAVVFAAYLTYEEPKRWGINLLIWPIALLIIFDRGHSKAIDGAYSALKHLKGKSDATDLVLYYIANEKLELAKSKLIQLKEDFPDENESIEIAVSELERYLDTKPWWHF